MYDYLLNIKLFFEIICCIKIYYFLIFLFLHVNIVTSITVYVFTLVVFYKYIVHVVFKIIGCLLTDNRFFSLFIFDKNIEALII